MDFPSAPTRPSAQEVAVRLLSLRFVVGYALGTPPPHLIQPAFKKWNKSDQAEFAQQAEQIRNDFWRPVRASPLWDMMSPQEQQFAETTVLSMTPQQHIDFSWRLEALQVLMWAMELLPEMSPYDIPAKPELLELFVFVDIADLIESPRLRSDAEIDKARDLAELWHWRSRTRELIESGQVLPDDPHLELAGLKSYDDIVRATARLCQQDGSVPVIDEDFAAYGKAYRDLSPEEWSEVRSVAMERHFALNWLCGYAPDNQWDETPIDT